MKRTTPATTCHCAYKQSMIDRMREYRRSHGSANWVELLLGEGSDDSSLCCLFTFLFYYGCCEENTMTVSELARQTLAPLMSIQPTE